VGTPASLGSTHVESRQGVPVMVRWVAVAVLISCTLFAGLAYAGTCPEGLQLQQWRQQLEEIKSQMRMALGTPGAASRMQGKYAQLAAKYPALFLEQEIKNYPLIANTNCLVWAMKQATGQELSYGQVNGGPIDLYLNKKVIRQGLSSSELLSIAKSLR
jgi:hypothetical protein